MKGFAESLITGRRFPEKSFALDPRAKNDMDASISR